MAYSRWADSFFYADSLTGEPCIDASLLFIHPKTGDAKTMSYHNLADVDAHWVALNFPDVPMECLHQLVEIVSKFRHDMKYNVYRYKGFKVPTW